MGGVGPYFTIPTLNIMMKILSNSGGAQLQQDDFG